MNRVKKYLLVLVGLVILSTVRWPPRLEAQGPPQRPRSFYLTPTTHNGAAALSACARGYHMASLWEILDPSNLRYDTDLGQTLTDSGSGPPSGLHGWIRTGTNASASAQAGVANCSAWQSDSSTQDGSAVFPSPLWNTPGVHGSPWGADTLACHLSPRVWCVQD
jgi:hypothetical protein